MTEGSNRIWERLHYDWSDPNRVVLTTTDSNVWGGNSGHTDTLTQSADGTTDVDVVAVREGKRRRRGGRCDRGRDHRASACCESSWARPRRRSKPGTTARGRQSSHRRHAGADQKQSHTRFTTPASRQGRSHVFGGFLDEPATAAGCDTSSNGCPRPRRTGRARPRRRAGSAEVVRSSETRYQLGLLRDTGSLIRAGSGRRRPTGPARCCAPSGSGSARELDDGRPAEHLGLGRRRAHAAGLRR